MDRFVMLLSRLLGFAVSVISLLLIVSSALRSTMIFELLIRACRNRTDEELRHVASQGELVDESSESSLGHI